MFTFLMALSGIKTRFTSIVEIFFYPSQEEDLSVAPQSINDATATFQFGQPAMPQSGFHF